MLAAQFKALADHRVCLEGPVLNPNMAKNKLKGPQASAEEIARLVRGMYHQQPRAHGQGYP